MSVSSDFEKGLSKAFKNELPNFKGGEDIGDMMTSLNKAQKSITNEDYDEFFEELEGEEKKEESKEATGAGSAGGYEAPLFSEPKKNNLFQPGTESKLTTNPKVVL